MKIAVSLFAALAVAMTMATGATDYPAKPVRFVLPLGAGGSTDIVARIFAVKLGEILKQPFVIDNRPGAGGIIAREAVARATPDGYTLLLCGISQAISPALKRNLPYDTWRDFARIAQYGAVPNVLVVHSSVPARSLTELVEYAKQNSGKLRYGSTGVGFTPHLTMELFKTKAGIDLLHVPYKSSTQVINDILGGQIHALFFNLPSQLPNIKAGKVRALAVTSAQRTVHLPDLATISELGYPGFDVTVWYGICAPAKTPKTVLATLKVGIAKALAAADLHQRFLAHGVEPRSVTGAAFDEFYKKEMSRWAQVVQDAGIKPE